MVDELSLVKEEDAFMADELSPEKEGEVLDFTYLDLEFGGLRESFADELVEIEERLGGAAVGLPEFMSGKDGKMMQLVSKEYIRKLMKSPPISKPLPDYSIEALRDTGIKDEVELETIARGFRALQSVRDTKNEIIQQYRAKGYAYVKLPENSKRHPSPASGN